MHRLATVHARDNQPTTNDVTTQHISIKRLFYYSKMRRLKSHRAPNKSRFADEIGERYEETKYSGGEVLQRWRGSCGNVRPSNLLTSFLLKFETATRGFHNNSSDLTVGVSKIRPIRYFDVT